MTENESLSFWDRCAGSSPRDRANQRRILWTTFAWAVAFVGVSQAIKKELLAEGPLLWALAVVPAVLGVVVIVAYSRFLREADELQRLIQLNALALGFGGGLFAFYAYRVFERLGAPQAHLEDATLVMIALYVLGIILGTRRYR